MAFLAYRFICRLVLAIVLACLSACTGNASISEETIRDFLPPGEIRDQRRTPDYYYLKLPEDQSADTSRSLQNFSFANLLATELQLDLKLYDLRGISDRQLAEYKANNQQHLLLAQEPVNATVILRNLRENRPIFMGKTDGHGRLRAYEKNIKRYRSKGNMSRRWLASALLHAETGFKKIHGHGRLGELRTILQEQEKLYKEVA